MKAHMLRKTCFSARGAANVFTAIEYLLWYNKHWGYALSRVACSEGIIRQVSYHEAYLDEAGTGRLLIAAS